MTRRKWKKAMKRSARLGTPMRVKGGLNQYLKKLAAVNSARRTLEMDDFWKVVLSDWS